MTKVTSVKKHDNNDQFDKCDKHDIFEKVTSLRKFTGVASVKNCNKIWQVWQNLITATMHDKCDKNLTCVTEFEKSD